MNDQLKSLYTKLKALAERGAPGEKENAERKLKQFLEKNGITESELLSIEQSDVIIPYYRNPLYFKLLLQIIVSSFLDKNVYKYREWDSKEYTHLRVELTDYEKTEILYLYDCYLQDFKKQYKKQLKQWKEDFVRGFIHKNEIFPATTDPDKPKKVPTLDELFRLETMMKAITKTEIHKRLQQSNR